MSVVAGGRQAASARLIRLADQSAGRGRLRLASQIHGIARSIGPDPLVVWSPQSSGSTSLSGALAASLDRPVLHIHHASAGARAVREAVRQEHGGTGIARREEREADWLLRRLAKRTPVNIVTLVRDPVARVVSHWFQVADAWDELTDDIDAISQSVSTFPLLAPGRDWFDIELRALAGVDLGAVDFDTATGFAITISSQARVLAIRTSDLSRVAEVALATFLGRPVSLSLTANRATDKGYSQIYRRFAEEGTLPVDVIDSLLSTPTATAVFAASEREAIRRQWSEAR